LEGAIWFHSAIWMGNSEGNDRVHFERKYNQKSHCCAKPTGRWLMIRTSWLLLSLARRGPYSLLQLANLLHFHSNLHTDPSEKCSIRFWFLANLTLSYGSLNMYLFAFVSFRNVCILTTQIM
jgi:hypothetical protein